jgi:hypothetical protein
LIDEISEISNFSSIFIENVLSRFIESVRLLAFHSIFNFFILCLNSCFAAMTMFWSSNKIKSRCTICSFSDTHMRENRSSFSKIFSSNCIFISRIVKFFKICYCQSLKSFVIFASNILLLYCVFFQTMTTFWKSVSISLRKVSLSSIKLRRATILLKMSCTICFVIDFIFSKLYINNKKARVRDFCLQSTSNCWVKIFLILFSRLLNSKM